jgi:16S rRNA (uracil1498-N3)-methyltransferase
VTCSGDAGATVLVSPGELAGERCEVRAQTYRHLFRARRLAAGELLRVVDGTGRAREGRVARVTRDRATIELGPEAPSREPPLGLTLLVGPPRAQRASWLVEKATELGVVAVRFVATERSGHDFGRGTLERLRRVAAAAVEQCGRSRLPEITGVHAWSDVPELLAGCPGRWICTPGAPASGAGARGPTAALVGPEGGWSPGELAAASGWGCRPLGLGERALRVETAAVAVAARLLATPSVDTPGGES